MRFVRCVVSTALTTVRIVAFHRNMTEIMKTMGHLQDKPVWRRFVRKDKHSDALAKHKQGLTHALVMFQVGFFLFTASIYLFHPMKFEQTKELVAIRHAQHRDHVQTAATLQELQTAGVIYSSTALIFHRLFFLAL